MTGQAPGQAEGAVHMQLVRSLRFVYVWCSQQRVVRPSVRPPTECHRRHTRCNCLLY